jgi:hypothetical protein
MRASKSHSPSSSLVQLPLGTGENRLSWVRVIGPSVAASGHFEWRYSNKLWKSKVHVVFRVHAVTEIEDRDQTDELEGFADLAI